MDDDQWPKPRKQTEVEKELINAFGNAFVNQEGVVYISRGSSADRLLKALEAFIKEVKRDN